MTINESKTFPDLAEADSDGLLAFGGTLEPSLVLHAYERGIFPWPFDEHSPLPWFSPDPRAIFDLASIHIPKKLKKTLQRNKFEVKFNTCFPAVIANCASIPRKDRPSTWITKKMIDCFTTLFNLGNAYSVEAFIQGNLVGGVYGIKINNFYSAESMFHKESDASKVCLVHLFNKLRSENIGWIDIQMVTNISKSLGAIEIPRNEFIVRLKQSLA